MFGLTLLRRAPLRIQRTHTVVSAELTRILSDIHFGDHASRVGRLAQLRPLFDGVSHLVLNGDTLDTRPGPFPAHTAECRAEVMAFFPGHVGRVTFLTGNHDADFSPHHHLDLAAGNVFVTHGDVFFDHVVPWSKDSTLIRRLIAAEVQKASADLHGNLDQRFAIIRRVTASIPQRHQSERNKLKYALHYIADTVWPPLRTLRIMRAWRLGPVRAAELTRRHRPAARFVLSGHTHRPGIWSMPPDLKVINTGSFCPPLGGFAIDLTANRLAVRQVAARNGEFRAGEIVSEFPLADA